MKKFPIIILHGWNLSGVKFQPLVKVFLKNKLHAIAPDFPGFGHNRILNRPYKLKDYVKNLEVFITKYGTKKVVLICHSFGGRVGIKYAAENQNKVKLLILTGVPGYRVENRLKITLFYALSKIGNFIFMLPILRNFRCFFHKLIYRVSGNTDYYKANGNLKVTFKNVIGEDLVIYMKKIRVPTVLIWGENDKTVPLSVAIKMKKIIKDSILKVIKGENHKVPYMAAEKFYNALKHFIDRGNYS